MERSKPIPRDGESLACTMVGIMSRHRTIPITTSCVRSKRRTLLMVGTIALVLAVLSCKAAQCPAEAADSRNLCNHGIPNLATVDKPEPTRHAVYRGGQP